MSLCAVAALAGRYLAPTRGVSCPRRPHHPKQSLANVEGARPTGTTAGEESCESVTESLLLLPFPTASGARGQQGDSRSRWSRRPRPGRCIWYTSSDSRSTISLGPCQWFWSLGEPPFLHMGQYTHTLSPGLKACLWHRVLYTRLWHAPASAWTWRVKS